MSYAAPPVAVAPAPRRPVTVTLAAAALALMAVAGLVYAVVTVVIAPGTVGKFRDATTGFTAEQVDDFVALVWIGAALALVLAVILFALYVVLALSLRRGSNLARIATWVICGLGLLAGAGSALTVLIQRGGDPVAGTIGAALSQAYPGSWIGLNVALSIAQMIGYVVVAVLLLASPGVFFKPTTNPAAPVPPAPVVQHGPWAPAPPNQPDDRYWARPST